MEKARSTPADTEARGGHPSVLDQDGGMDGTHAVPAEHMQGYLGYVLRRAQLAVFQDVIHVLSAFDLRPPQFSLLTILARSPGLRQADVADLLAVQRTNMVKMVDVLEERGLVRRERSPEDRRAHALYLTEAGTAFLRDASAAVDRHEARITETLGQGDRDELLRLLKRLVREYKPGPLEEEG